MAVRAAICPAASSPPLSGDFLPTFGHHADDFGFELVGEGDDLGRVGHFEIEPGANGLSQFPDVTVLNVAAVFAQMGGDAMSTRLLADQRGRHGVWFADKKSTVTGLPQSGDVVDVNAEFQHLTSRA